jgi:hypothetical protein
MKKLIYLPLFSSVLFLASCGQESKETNKEETNKEETKKEEVATCDCESLKKGKGKNRDKMFTQEDQPYTGRCLKTDEFDSVVATRDYENGFKMSEIFRRRIYKNYITVHDLKYDTDGEKVSGYERSFEEINLENQSKLMYTKYVTIHEGSKIKDDYNTEISHFPGDTYAMFTFNWSRVNFKERGISEGNISKCLPAATYEDYNHGYKYTENDMNNFSTILDCMKKGEDFPMFTYIKE